MSRYVDEQLQDFLLHKQYVLKSGNLMINYLLRNHRQQEALSLLKRLAVHDNSKIFSDELDYIMKLSCNKQSFTNPNYSLSEDEKIIIEKHWKHNKHHPEYHDNIEDMSELDIMEMVCDWHSRSTQYGTDFFEFVTTRQENRFHFPKEMFEKILKYCDIIQTESNAI